MPGFYKVERWKEVYPPNPAYLRLLLNREGYTTVFQWGDRIGTFYGPHFHNEDQSHWVVSGLLEIHVKDVGTFQLGPGDRDFMPAGTYHTAEVLGDQPAIYLVGVKPVASRAEPKTRKPKQAGERKPAKKRGRRPRVDTKPD